MLKCPKCTHEMETVTHKSVEIDRCTSCSGLWFDDTEQERLKALRGADLVDVGDPAVGSEYDAKRAIKCPRCRVPMVARSTMHKEQTIHYELCPLCQGLFLDAGEFRHLKDAPMWDLVQQMLD